jgi:hypothetical protein
LPETVENAGVVMVVPAAEESLETLASIPIAAHEAEQNNRTKATVPAASSKFLRGATRRGWLARRDEQSILESRNMDGAPLEYQNRNWKKGGSTSLWPHLCKVNRDSSHLRASVKKNAD